MSQQRTTGRSERELIEAALRDVQAPKTPAAPAPLSLPPQLIAGYELLHELHRGGQGVVYVAVQKATRRRVAIKVMREGPFADAREIARFEREVHVLGQLRHPGIVTIHDSGEASGHFYLVMDLIPGLPLDRHLRERAQTLPQRLRLFIEICRAVNAAHLRGVIHRDLKPGNIIIDDEGAPHVLDFGLAKLDAVAAAGDFAETQLQAMSRSGQFIGSLPWASPEQAEGRPELIDLRTDVYALGAILYQMLTGRLPVDTSGPPAVVLERIRAAEHSRPSSIARGIDDDLDTIVLKCLASVRDRRYQSAGEVAGDVERSLAGEPIEAKRDSAWYVLRKQLKRHRAPVAVGAVYVVLVTASVVGLTLLWHRTALAQADTSELGRMATEIATLFYDERAVSDPFNPTVPPPEALAKLEEVAARHETARLDADLEAALRTTVGVGSLKARQYADAERHLARAASLREVLGPGLPLAESLHNLGRALFYNGKYAEAEQADRRAIEIRREILGPRHLDVADSENDLAANLLRQGRMAEAEALLRRTFQTRQDLLPDDDPWVAASMNNLASCLRARGAFPEALDLYTAALAVGERRRINPLYVARGWRGIARCHLGMGRPAEAEAAARRALVAVQGLPGDLMAETGACQALIAAARLAAGDLAVAEDVGRSALLALLASRPDPNPDTASAQVVLGRILRERGQLAEAETLLEEALATQRALVGDDHPDVAEVLLELAKLREVRGTGPSSPGASRGP